MIDKSLYDEFSFECKNAFGFLVTDYSFSGPEIETINNHPIKVSYFKKDIAIQCGLDVRDEGEDVRIIRLLNGNKPNVWRVNKRGEVVAEYLSALLRCKGVRDFKYEEPHDSENLTKRQRSFRKGLLGDARLLRKYGQEILDGFAKTFENYHESGDNF